MTQYSTWRYTLYVRLREEIKSVNTSRQKINLTQFDLSLTAHILYILGECFSISIFNVPMILIQHNPVVLSIYSSVYSTVAFKFNECKKF